MMFAFIGDYSDETINHMNKITKEWEMKAARGECGWICSDCCCGFDGGMPDSCIHGFDWCTKLIERDKVESES